MIAATMIHHLTASDPAAELFRQALGLETVASLTVIATNPTTAQTLLFEVWHADKPGRPEKRYLYTTDGTAPAPAVCAFMPHKAQQLASLLAHPEIKVTALDAESAIAVYNEVEARFPSRETLRNGQPRHYLPPVLD